jgi:hypothetical protein
MKESELVATLATMEIPEANKDLSKSRNLFWLLRNLRVRNSQHPKLQDVIEELKQLARLTN